MAKDDYHFERLTPINDIELKVYEEAINYVFENQDIKNVACFLQALFGEKCKIFLENVASPNWRKLQGLGWQLFCQLHSHCRPYLVVIA